SIRQHLPIVIYTTSTAVFHLPKIVLLTPESAEQLADMALIAHKISEKTLGPVMIYLPEDLQKDQLKTDCLEGGIIRKYLGQPEELIETPTPAQAVLFGKKRRRVPAFYSLDYPGMLGQLKNVNDGNNEGAANEAYFKSHQEEIIRDAIAEYNRQTGQDLAFERVHQSGKIRHLLVCLAPDAKKIIAALSHSGAVNETVLYALGLLNPLSVIDMGAVLKGCLTVTVVAPEEVTSSLADEIKGQAVGLKSPPKVISAPYSRQLNSGDLDVVWHNMVQPKPYSKIYPGVDFYGQPSAFPKFTALQQQVIREYPDLPSFTQTERTTSGVSAAKGSYLPANIRKYQDRGPGYGRLTWFKDHTTAFYRNDQEHKAALPFQALPFSPSPSAAFLDAGIARTFLPVFNPLNCTACGDCYVNCPHSALPPVAISVEALIRAGMEMASTGTKMTPYVKNLAKIAGKIIDKADRSTGFSTASFLPAAFEQLLEKLNADEEKANELKNEFENLMRAIGELPLAVTDRLYAETESYGQGGGELFSLAVDTSACTGCGICVTSCSESALELQDSEEQLSEFHTRVFKIWEGLPDTPSATISHLLKNEMFNPFSALYLSRNFYSSLVGATDKEEMLPAKRMVHAILAVTESIIQPGYGACIEKAKVLVEGLGEQIHSHLADSLPKENFSVIGDILNQTGSEKISIRDLINGMASSENNRPIDVGIVNRKIQLLKDLQSLGLEMTDGITGAGRARMGLVIDDRKVFEWANNFPFNPFIAPAFVHGSVEMALGLMDGLIRHAVDNIKLMRRAALEISNKYNPEIHDQEIAALNWQHLSAEEREMVPPVLMIGSATMFREMNRERFYALINTDKPVKWIVLDDVNINPEKVGELGARLSDLLSFIHPEGPYLCQESAVFDASLFNGLVKGLARKGPAVFRFFVPDTRQLVTGMNWAAAHGLSACTRNIPSFEYDPDKYTEYVSLAISLEGNVSPHTTWHKEKMMIKESGEEKDIDYEMTWADWAYTQKNWAGHFEKYEGEYAVPLGGYLRKDTPSGDDAPVIWRVDEQGKLINYKVSQEVIGACRIVARSWNLLREISGNLIEFPQKLEEKVKGEYEKVRQQEVEQVKTEYEDKIRSIKEEQMEEIREKLKRKLMAMAAKR
ncbi:MAG: hypothetical protein OEX02_07785, partial [Cyclobacteriaceae bacterium]|nr:hypothetical protein [Cyclobacteriaceae bacterium]